MKKAEIIHLAIPGAKVPSANTLLRMHWAARGRLQKEIDVAVFAAIATVPWTETQEIPRARAEAHFTAIIKRREDRTDQDNLNAGLKFYIDALKHNGLIVDDGPDWFKFTADQTTCNHHASKKTGLDIAIKYERERAR